MLDLQLRSHKQSTLGSMPWAWDRILGLWSGGDSGKTTIRGGGRHLRRRMCELPMNKKQGQQSHIKTTEDSLRQVYHDPLTLLISDPPAFVLLEMLTIAHVGPASLLPTCLKFVSATRYPCHRKGSPILDDLTCVLGFYLVLGTWTIPSI